MVSILAGQELWPPRYGTSRIFPGLDGYLIRFGHPGVRDVVLGVFCNAYLYGIATAAGGRYS